MNISMQPRHPRRPSLSTRLIARLVSAIGSIALVAVVSAAPAGAHAALISSSPQQGADLTSLPDEVSFTFDQNISTPAYVAVTAPDGSSIITGSPTIVDATISQAVKPVDEKGEYSMAYRVVSADGHPVSATLTFTVSTGRTVTQHDVAPATGGHSEHSAGDSIWGRHSTEIVIAVVVVVLGAALLIGSGATARGRRD